MWDFFDKIYCINLRIRKDRYSQSKQVFDRLKIPVEYFFAEKHLNGGEQGCFESHVSICKKAVKQNFDRIIIFEDDIIETSECTQKNISHIIRVLKNLKNWDIFYLGCFPMIHHQTFATKHRDIYHSRALGTHAYILNKSFINTVSQWKWDGLAYDAYTSKNYHYCYMPRLFDQRAVSSDIPRGFNIINYSPFLKKIILDLNDWYAITIGYNIYSVILVIIIIILIVFIIKIRSQT